MYRQSLIFTDLLLICLVLAGCYHDPDFAPALAPVCMDEVGVPGAGVVTPGAIYPIVILNYEDGSVSHWHAQLPADWRADSLAETRYVVCISDIRERVIETCHYYGPDIDRHSYYFIYQIRNSRTGDIVLAESIYGTSPRNCRYQEEYSLTDLYGEEPTVDDLINRIRVFVER